MKKDKTYLIDVINEYRAVANILEKVILGKITPLKALTLNPFIQTDIKIALTDAGYIK